VKRLFHTIFLFHLLLVPLYGQEDELYTHTGLDGIILAESDTWYYEEFDIDGRPSEGIRWEKNEIVERTTWTYYEETQQVRLSVSTTDTLITETEYDLNGNVIAIREIPAPQKDKEENENDENDKTPKPDKKVQPVQERIITYSYDERNLLRETLTRQGDMLVKIRFEYGEDERLAEKSVYKNGELTIRYVYSDEENWKEIVYHDDLVILTVMYQNGERTRIQYETW